MMQLRSCVLIASVAVLQLPPATRRTYSFCPITPTLAARSQQERARRGHQVDSAQLLQGWEDQTPSATADGSKSKMPPKRILSVFNRWCFNTKQISIVLFEGAQVDEVCNKSIILSACKATQLPGESSQPAAIA